MFHPDSKFNEVVGGLLLLLAAAIALLVLDPEGGVVLALIAILLLASFVPRINTTRSYLEVDTLGMRQVHDSPPFDIPWAEVRAVRLTEAAQRKTFLQVGDDEGWNDISLYELNADAVWTALADFAPHAVLEEERVRPLAMDAGGAPKRACSRRRTMRLSASGSAGCGPSSAGSAWSSSGQSVCSHGVRATHSWADCSSCSAS